MAGRSYLITRPAIRVRALAAAAFALGAAACDRTPPDGVALVGATVFDGTSPQPQLDQVIIVRNDKIEAIGTRAEVDIPRRMRTVDLSGRFIVPGLIDGHVHLQRWTLPRFLAAGVTTVRDVHGPFDSILALREQANLGSLTSPRIFSAGAMIDAAPATYSDAFVVGGANDARKAVDKLAVTGVDYVKVYTRITPELLRAIVDEAQTFGLRVTAHLGLTDAVTAGEIGVRSIEHMSGVPEAAVANNAALYAAHREGFFDGWTAFEKAWAGLDSATLARVAEQLVADRVTIVPTLVLHETLSRLDDPATMQDSSLRLVPDSEMSRWDVPGMVARAGWTAEDFSAFRASRPNQDLFVRIYRASGGKVVAGTDAANQLIVPGQSLIRELELLVQAGFSNTDALFAATRDAALLLGADSLGALVPGRKADLIILARDPVADIGNLRSIQQVMVRGHLMSTDSLRRHW
ncbi:MAG: amidohydrolase [Gemmatimonadetes bacterium]|nr:amidohydrolase [Gemmatimonadota bacterium]